MPLGKLADGALQRLQGDARSGTYARPTALRRAQQALRCVALLAGFALGLAGCHDDDQLCKTVDGKTTCEDKRSIFGI